MERWQAGRPRDVSRSVKDRKPDGTLLWDAAVGHALLPILGAEVRVRKNEALKKQQPVKVGRA